MYHLVLRQDRGSCFQLDEKENTQTQLLQFILLQIMTLSVNNHIHIQAANGITMLRKTRQDKTVNKEYNGEKYKSSTNHLLMVKQ